MPKFSLIMPAAGKSSRFKDRHYKKPFAPLDGRAVWLHSAEKFLNREDCAQLILVISAQDREMFDLKFWANAAILGVEVVEGQAYNKYLAQGLSAGDTLSFRIQGAGLTGNLAPILAAVGGALAVLLAVGAGFARYLRGGGQPDVPTAASTFTAEQEALIRQIADLDDTFEAGRVNRLEYEAMRVDHKAKLAELFEDET